MYMEQLGYEMLLFPYDVFVLFFFFLSYYLLVWGLMTDSDTCQSHIPSPIVRASDQALERFRLPLATEL